jgi:hypothetical protein
MKWELSEVNNSKSERFNVKCLLIYKEDKLKNARYRHPVKKENGMWNIATFKNMCYLYWYKYVCTKSRLINTF